MGVPGVSDDIYLRHQQVWQAMHGIARPGRGADFLFAQKTNRLYVIRSHRLDARHGRVVMPPTRGESRRLEVDLVAMQGQDHDVPIRAESVGEWAAAQLKRHGLEICGLQVLALHRRVGLKRAKLPEQSTLRIEIQTATIRADVRVVDQMALSQAFAKGVGRGKRFGYGMLRFS